MRFARGLDRGKADTFVGMYVNERTVDLGSDGRRSIQLFLDRAAEEGLIPAVGRVDFVS